MAITRLSGGTSPANGSDPRTFPAIWNATADDIEQAETDIATLQGDVSAIEAWDLDDINDVVITTPADGEVLTYDNGDWVNQAVPAPNGFTASQTITATNASWPVPTLGSPIIKVTVMGGGGGGSNSGTAGSGTSSTFNAGGAGTLTGAGGRGANAGGDKTGTAGLATANGGMGYVQPQQGGITTSTASNGNGGQMVVGYLDMTEISTVNVTIGSGGSSSGQAGAGSRGEVIVEYVAV